MSASIDRNEDIHQCLALLKARFTAVENALEILTVFDIINLKSVAYLIEDTELLRDAAMALHQAVDKAQDFPVLEPTPLAANEPRRAQLLVLPERAKQASAQTAEAGMNRFGALANAPEVGRATNAGEQEPSAQPAPKAENRPDQQAAPSTNRPRAYRVSIIEPDWLALHEIKRTKLYKGMQFVASGEAIILKTFDEYCRHVIGMVPKMVNYYLRCLENLGDELFLALRRLGMSVKIMRGCCTLTAEQKQALLHVVQTETSAKAAQAAVLAFIDQALQAGE